MSGVTPTDDQLGDRIYVTTMRWLNRARLLGRRDDPAGYNRWSGWALALTRTWGRRQLWLVEEELALELADPSWLTAALDE